MTRDALPGTSRRFHSAPGVLWIDNAVLVVTTGEGFPATPIFSTTRMSLETFLAQRAVRLAFRVPSACPRPYAPMRTFITQNCPAGLPGEGNLPSRTGDCCGTNLVGRFGWARKTDGRSMHRLRLPKNLANANRQNRRRIQA